MDSPDRVSSGIQQVCSSPIRWVPDAAAAPGDNCAHIENNDACSSLHIEKNETTLLSMIIHLNTLVYHMTDGMSQ